MIRCWVPLLEWNFALAWDIEQKDDEFVIIANFLSVSIESWKWIR